jgi:hypothetical protein
VTRRLVTKARRDPTVRPEMTASQRRVQRLLLDAAGQVRDIVASREGQINDAAVHGPTTRLLALVDLSPYDAITVPLIGELHADLLDAATAAAKDPYANPLAKAAGDVQVSGTFNRKSPLAANWAADKGARLVREVTEGQRDLIRDYTWAASMGQVEPREMARYLRGSIGLTRQQAGWVANNRSFLYQSNLTAGFTEQQARALADKGAERYYARILKYRTENIARTEILTAANEGRQQAWSQGIREGWIAPDSWKQWTTQFDERTCDECGHMDGEQSPYAYEFQDGDPPRHPSCRCTTFLIPNPNANLANLTGLTSDQIDSEIAHLLGVPGESLGGPASSQADLVAMRGRVVQMRSTAPAGSEAARITAIHEADLDRIPAGAWRRLDRAGYKVRIFDGGVTSQPEMQMLKGVRPRGWGEGQTWDIVPGLHSGSDKLVLAGNEGRHGATSLLLHETGHALDFAWRPTQTVGGYYARASLTPQFREAYTAAVQAGDIRTPYLLQGGGAGEQEAFAEGVAVLLRGSDPWGYFSGGPGRFDNPAGRHLLDVIATLIEDPP